VNALYERTKQTFLTTLLILFIVMLFNTANASNKFLRAQADIESIETIINVYKLDFNKYPSSLKEIHSRFKAIKRDNKSTKDFKTPVDPWGNIYI